MATAQQYIEKAASYIGISGTDNIFNTWYWGYHCYDPDSYPWCAAFISYVACHDLNMPIDPSALAVGVAWQCPRVADEDAQPGDFVLFTWDGRQDFSCADHIGVIEWCDINGSGYFGTIEGNTGNTSGGEVARCTRYNWGSYGTAFFRPPYNDSPGTQLEPEPEPVYKYPLNCIDIASWEAGITPSNTTADAVIVKVTGGTHYENPYWRQWADDVLASGKCLALYHYAVESEDDPDPREEAEFFLARVGDYIGKFIPVLDWEADAVELDQSWAREWLDIVAERTGATPWFYGYASNINNSNYDQIADKYPLWMAAYSSKYAGGGFVEDPDQRWGSGDWDKITAYQYTSEGRIPGYDNDLDLSVFYGTAKDWYEMCNGSYAPPTPGGDGPRYAVCSYGKWYSDMRGSHDTGGSSDDFAGDYGHPMTYLAIEGVGKYRVCTKANGWLPYVDHFDKNDEEYGMAGDGSHIIAVEIPNSNVRFACHTTSGRWLPDMIGTKDTGGSSDTYGGDMTLIDAIRIRWA